MHVIRCLVWSYHRLGYITSVVFLKGPTASGAMGCPGCQSTSESGSRSQLLRLTVFAELDPVYFSDVCMPLSDIPSRAGLRAAERGNRFVPATKTKISSPVGVSASQDRLFGTLCHIISTHGHSAELCSELANNSFIPGSLQLTFSSENY